MALVGKRDDLIHVPWSSVEEWLQVYKQIYSSNTLEQNKAYETLLVWKARKPQLPVGVECTLGLIQVCLRDREWTPKIHLGEISASYENDLRMLYSTVIMKFLNHISNIAHDKQTSLFVIAKQLNIPDWIVDLRHNIAHGHELPSVDVMRVVTNILLTWLHEEYWAAIAKNFYESEQIADFDNIDFESDKLINLIELWTAVGLYMKTEHVLLSDLPDTEIKNTLKNVLGDPNLNNEESELLVISYSLLSEISKNLNKSDSSLKEKVVIDTILNNDAFLTNPEILSIFIKDRKCDTKNCLPPSLIEFWKDILVMLQEKKILLPLFLELIELVKKENDTNTKLMASLWVKAIAQAFNKLKISRYVYQTLEQRYDHHKVKVTSKGFLKKVSKEVENLYPELKSALTLNINGDFPNCLTDENFVKRLILHYTEFSEYYLPEILKISSFLDSDSNAKEKLLDLMKIHSLKEKNEGTVSADTKCDKVYTVEDLQNIEKQEKQVDKTPKIKKHCNEDLADSKDRNSDWEMASDDCDWSNCPIGILPWQIDDFEQNELTISPSEIRYAIIKNLELPKIIDSNKLKLHSKIQWENLLKKKKKIKKKTNASEAVETNLVTENITVNLSTS